MLLMWVAAVWHLCIAPARRPGGPARGQGLVEYALIILLVAIAAVAALLALSGQLDPVFRRVAASLQ